MFTVQTPLVRIFFCAIKSLLFRKDNNFRNFESLKGRQE